MTPLNSKTITLKQLAKTIDHSLLRPELTETEVIAGCELAKKYDVASVCVKPCHVRLAAKVLKGSGVRVSTVIGFPHGSNCTAIKVAEARQAISDGAVELDMVLNIGELRSGNYDYVRDDIKAVVDIAHPVNALVKVILENAYLTNDQKVTACHLVEESGGDFVKTSTGFAPSGATLDDVRLMRQNVSSHIQVKAAGGVRTLEAALQMIDAGVTRMGATATATILDEFAKQQEAK
jgi:deoxyribose-phosphate aldolase